MATTTPNYGWDVPTSTDYVKDGATAIETLGDDIDASLFSITGGKNVGLVHINTSTLSGSTFTLSNIFTSAFDSYRIMINGLTLTTGATAVRYQLTKSGTPTTTNVYYTSIWTMPYSGTATLINVNGSGSAYIGEGATDSRDLIFDIQRPALATFKTSTLTGSQSGGQIVGGHLMVDTSAHDGIRLNNDLSRTFSGTIRVYGYRNS